jgi:paraquat-inducible protein B
MYRRKRIDPRVIGSFVVGAIILSVAGLLFFGPGGLLTETSRYVIYFDSSVKGLKVGSPVRFRGVKIGQVKEINVRVRPKNFEFYIPVVIEIETARIRADGTKKSLMDTLKMTLQDEDLMLPLIAKGLRAQMALDSLVTGQLYVNLDMLPEAPLIITGYDSDYPELPAITSSLAEITRTFENIPFKELADKLISSAEGFETLVNSPNLHNALANLDKTTSQLNQFLENLNERFVPLVDTLEQTIEDGQTTIRHLDQKIDPLSEQLSQAAKAVHNASVTTSAAMEQVKGLTGDDSQLMEQFGQTLHEMNMTAREIRYLTSEIEQDPQILLRGRAAEGKK